MLRENRRAAVELLAQGRLTDDAIAERIGVTRMTLHRWRKDPAFAAAVQDAADAIVKALRDEGIANKDNLIAGQIARHTLMVQVIEARAEANRKRNAAVAAGRGGDLDFDGYAAAGAETGLLAHTITYLRDGRREEWAVDASLLRELRELEKLIATEKGMVDDGKSSAIFKHLDLNKLTDDQLERIANGDDPIRVLIGG